jgi:hypothetical protein
LFEVLVVPLPFPLFWAVPDTEEEPSLVLDVAVLLWLESALVLLEDALVPLDVVCEAASDEPFEVVLPEPLVVDVLVACCCAPMLCCKVCANGALADELESVDVAAVPEVALAPMPVGEPRRDTSDM